MVKQKRNVKQPDRYGNFVAPPDTGSGTELDSCKETMSDDADRTIATKSKGRPRGSRQAVTSKKNNQQTLDETEAAEVQKKKLEKIHGAIEVFGNEQHRLMSKALKEVTRYKKEVEKSQQVNIKLEAENNELRAENLKRSRLDSHDQHFDYEIQEKFRQIQRKVKAWCREWGCQGHMSQVSEGPIADIAAELATVSSPYTNKLAFFDAIKEGITKHTILGALLTKTMFEGMLHQIFFFLRGANVAPTFGSLSNALSAIHELMQMNDPEKTKKWLRQTMDLLEPLSTIAPRPFPGSNFTVQDLKEEQYDHLARSFNSCVAAKHLLREVEDVDKVQRVKDTSDIFRETGDYLLKLQSQGLHIEAWSFVELRDATFKCGSDLVLPHPCLSMEQEDARCKSGALLMVTWPAVVLYTGFNRKAIENRKVLSQGEVIVRTQTADLRTQKISFTESPSGSLGVPGMFGSDNIFSTSPRISVDIVPRASGYQAAGFLDEQLRDNTSVKAEPDDSDTSHQALKRALDGEMPGNHQKKPKLEEDTKNTPSTINSDYIPEYKSRPVSQDQADQYPMNNSPEQDKGETEQELQAKDEPEQCSGCKTDSTVRCGYHKTTPPYDKKQHERGRASTQLPNSSPATKQASQEKGPSQTYGGSASKPIVFDTE